MKHTIKRVAVIGAGTMGSQITALFANSGLACDLMDIVPADVANDAGENARDTIAQGAVDRMRGARVRSPFYVPESADRVRVGNLEDHADRLREADWVIEAVTERLDAKRAVHQIIDKHRRPTSIVSTNTSGISVEAIAEGRSDDFRACFLGVHFFNPPRYMHLLEVIPTPHTDPDTLTSVREFSERALGKGVVLCKDTPNFIANRVGIFAIVDAIREMIEMELSIDEVDAITGLPVGRPRSGTFRLSDLIGIDILVDVANNLPSKDAALPEFVAKMLDQGNLGDKTGKGFYEKRKGEAGSEIWTLDWHTLDYVPQTRVEFESLDSIRRIRNVGERVQTLVNHPDNGGQFAWRCLRNLLSYTAASIPEISDDLPSIDQAMKWGFNWEVGPFELWDAIGVQASVERMSKEGVDPSPLVTGLLASGADGFYTGNAGIRVFHPLSKSHEDVASPTEQLDLARLKREGATVRSNDGACLVDLGDGVACLEFQTKMNIIDESVEELLTQSLDEVERNFTGLVIGNHSEHFSLGANLVLMLETAKAKEWETLDAFLIALQTPCSRARTLTKPVVAAPSGMALGGGAEIVLGASSACAFAETYIGLVEVSVGLIPAGGGSREVAARCLEGIGESNMEEGLTRLETKFRTIVTAQVSDNAYHAQSMGYLRATDRIAANRDRHLYEAKQMVLDLAKGYQPHPSREIFALGSLGIHHLKTVAREMRDAGTLTDYDIFIADELAHVLCGGALSQPQLVTEDHLLKLEREAFLRLFAEEKTHERIAHTLKTGKPLRN